MILYCNCTSLYNFYNKYIPLVIIGAKQSMLLFKLIRISPNRPDTDQSEYWIDTDHFGYLSEFLLVRIFRHCTDRIPIVSTVAVCVRSRHGNIWLARRLCHYRREYGRRCLAGLYRFCRRYNYPLPGYFPSSLVPLPLPLLWAVISYLRRRVEFSTPPSKIGSNFA